MIRNAFKMKLKPGCIREYRQRHDTIWPELQQLLTDAGIRDYSIFLDEETNTLFAYQLIDEGFDSDHLKSHLVMRKWWTYMRDLMETYPDDEPVATPLTEVFHMD